MLTLHWIPAIYDPPFSGLFLRCLREANKFAKVTAEHHFPWIPPCFLQQGLQNEDGEAAAFWITPSICCPLGSSVNIDAS